MTIAAGLCITVCDKLAGDPFWKKAGDVLQMCVYVFMGTALLFMGYLVGEQALHALGMCRMK